MGKSERQSALKVKQWRGKLQEKQLENRHLRQKLKELRLSRDHQRCKVKRLRAELAKVRGGRMLGRGDLWSEERLIKGHKYDLNLVSLCVSLYAFAGCSLRGVGRVLVYLHLEYGIAFGAFPSKSSIENWVQKVGLYRYMQVGEDMWSEYCMILDESMVIGQQRMLLVLGVCAQKQGVESLRLEAVKVLGFAVKASWKWQEVRDFLQAVQEKVGKRASYVVCDGGCNLKKGVAESGLLRICDVGHEMCKWTEQTYRQDERFQCFIKAVTRLRFAVFMKPSAYLMPPKQRTVARFTNLSYVVEWAVDLCRVLPQLTAIEKQTFGWLQEHEALIGELAEVFQRNEAVLKILKKEGLSAQSIEQSIFVYQKQPTAIPACLIQKVVGYLQEEKAKLPHDKIVWHASSDAIESLFGKYKYKAASNALNGITPLVLSLCVYTDSHNEQQALKQQIKQALETIPMAKLATWKKENLVDNQLLRRRKLFEK